MPYPLLKLAYGLQRRLRDLTTLTEAKSLHVAAGLQKNYLIKPIQIRVLRQEFLNTVETIFNYSGEQWNPEPIMKASYEYFRRRNLLNITDFTAEEEAQLKNQMPTVFFKLSSHEAGLFDCVPSLMPEYVFDYAIYRSGCQFLFDDVGKFVPDSFEKDKQIEYIIECFDDYRSLLLRDPDDGDIDKYPTEASPEHEGVPGWHKWWRLIKMYDP